MKDDERQASLARAGKIYLQDLAFTDQSTTDETLEAIDRYFDRPYFNLTEDELARFAEALAAAGLDLLRQDGLPTDLGDINDLEDVFDSNCRHQPRRPFGLKSTIEHENALADWKEAHSAYWKGLRDSPGVHLFTDERLIAAYRMQAASINLIDALITKQPARIFAESMKLTMLAIRAGVFEKVSKAERFTHGGRQHGAVSAATKFVRHVVKNNSRESAKGMLFAAKTEAETYLYCPFDFTDAPESGDTLEDDTEVFWDEEANRSRKFKWFERRVSEARNALGLKKSRGNTTPR